MIRISSPVDRLLLLSLGVATVSLLVARVHGQDASESAEHFAELQENNAAPSQSEGYWRPTADDLDNILEAVDARFQAGFSAEDNVAAQILPRLDRPWIWGGLEQDSIQILNQLGVDDADSVPHPRQMSCLLTAVCGDVEAAAFDDRVSKLAETIYFFQVGGGDSKGWARSFELERLDEDFPILARLRPWLEANDAIFDDIVEASRGDHWFVPTQLPADQPDACLLFCSEEVDRAVRRLNGFLVIRSLRAVERGDWEQAWVNCLAIRNLATLVGQSQVSTGSIFATFGGRTACELARYLIERTDLVTELGARRLLADWIERPLDWKEDLIRTVDVFERAVALHLFHRLHQGRHEPRATWNALFGPDTADDSSENSPFYMFLQNRSEADLGTQFELVNSFYDRAVDAVREPTGIRCWQACRHVYSEVDELSEQPLRQFPVSVLLPNLFPPSELIIAAQVEAVDRHRMVALALAAAAGGPDRNEVEATLASIDSQHSPEHWLHSSVDGFAFVVAPESGRVIIRRDLERQTDPKIARVPSLNDPWQVAVPVEDQ